MREYDRLTSFAYDRAHLARGLELAVHVLATERIIEDDDRLRDVRIRANLGNEEREGERSLVSCA